MTGAATIPLAPRTQRAVRPPLAGRAVIACSGCRAAVDLADLRWWPRPPGMRTVLRVGCSGCVARAQRRLTRGYR